MSYELFNDKDEDYTPEGQRLEDAMSKALYDIVLKMHNKGARLRDVANVSNGAICAIWGRVMNSKLNKGCMGYRISVILRSNQKVYVAKDQTSTYDASWYTNNPKQIKLWKTRKGAECWISQHQAMEQLYLPVVEEVFESAERELGGPR